MPEKAGDALSTQDRAAVLDLAFRKRGEGLKADAAARAALDEMIAGIRDKLGKDAPAKAEQRPQEPEPPLVTKTGRSLPVPTVESIVKSITKWWKNAPAIIVIDTMLDAPKEVFDKYQRETKAAMKAGERPGEVRASSCRTAACSSWPMPRQTHGLWWARYSTKCSAITGCAAPSASASSRSGFRHRHAPGRRGKQEYRIRHGVAVRRQRRKLTANAILRGMTKDDRPPPLKKCWSNWRSSTDLEGGRPDPPPDPRHQGMDHGEHAERTAVPGDVRRRPDSPTSSSRRATGFRRQGLHEAGRWRSAVLKPKAWRPKMSSATKAAGSAGDITEQRAQCV